MVNLVGFNENMGSHTYGYAIIFNQIAPLGRRNSWFNIQICVKIKMVIDGGSLLKVHTHFARNKWMYRMNSNNVRAVWHKGHNDSIDGNYKGVIFLSHPLQILFLCSDSIHLTVGGR